MKTTERILKLMAKRAGKSITRKELKRRHGIASPAAMMFSLAAQGLVERTGRGQYRLKARRS